MRKLTKINEHNARYERGEETFKVALNHLSDLVPIYLFILKIVEKISINIFIKLFKSKIQKFIVKINS